MDIDDIWRKIHNMKYKDLEVISTSFNSLILSHRIVYGNLQTPRAGSYGT